MKAATTFHENPSCRMWHFDPCLINLCSFSTGRHCDFAVHFQRHISISREISRNFVNIVALLSSVKENQKFDIFATIHAYFLQHSIFTNFLFEFYAPNGFPVMINCQALISKTFQKLAQKFSSDKRKNQKSNLKFKAFAQFFTGINF